jgi:hypothetical protein
MRLAGLLLAFACAGCLAAQEAPPRYVLGPLGAPVDPLGPDAYRVIWVHGQQDEPGGTTRVMCSIAPNHDIDVAARTLRLAEGVAKPGAPRWALVFDVFEKESDCPVAYAVAFDQSEHAQSVGKFGTLALTVLANGSVEADGRLVPPGSSLSVTHAHGRFAVDNLGAWPRSGLS